MMSDDGSFDFLVRQKLDGAFIGLVNISPYENKSFHQEALSYEVSYQLVPDYWNKRYGSEILGRIFEYAAATLSLKRLWAETQKANLASIRLLEKMGMEHQEQVERFGETQLIYAITLTSDKF